MSSAEPRAVLGQEETGLRTVTLSLVSHTNVGKTTLARTLLREDVGEVLDQAHTTDVNEAYVLIRTAESELRLWDTPGFGDSLRLLKRLQRHEQPVLWFLQQLWDRVTDRPLWCSQQAALNVREDADLVLYLVNATEDPAEAGYVGPELELLSWIGRPILLLLNQTGGPHVPRARLDERIELWRRHVERWPVVRDVAVLDAFSRCWVQESLLLRRVSELLDDDLAGTMEELREAWDERNLDVFARSVTAMSDYLARAALDREELPERRKIADGAKKKAMEALGTRLQEATDELMSTLIVIHGLEGRAAVEIERQIDSFLVEGEDLLKPEQGALWGGVVSGALGGLTADVLAGGFTFGGGLVAGAILGALGGAGLARGYQLVKGEQRPAAGWSPDFLDQLVAQMLLRYLAVAHFGRGQGEFRELEASSSWQATVTEALRLRSEGLADAWHLAAKDAGRGELTGRLRDLVDSALREILVASYPKASALLAIGDLVELRDVKE